MEIRYALPQDIPGMSRVYVDTWKAAYRGMIPKEYLHGLDASRWEDRCRQTFNREGSPKAAVITQDGQVIGVSSFSKTRDDDLPPSYGEIISIYVLPEYWHMGYGTRMLAWVAEEMKGLGFSSCALWTLEENARAQRAYQRFGFKRDGARKSQEIGGAQVWEVRYRLNLSDQA